MTQIHARGDVDLSPHPMPGMMLGEPGLVVCWQKLWGTDEKLSYGKDENENFFNFKHGELSYW
jgi:hypothetical protein